jgi:hypothetical protein
MIEETNDATPSDALRAKFLDVLFRQVATIRSRGAVPTKQAMLLARAAGEAAAIVSNPGDTSLHVAVLEHLSDGYDNMRVVLAYARPEEQKKESKRNG